MTTPEKNVCLSVLVKEYIVTGRKANIKKGHPRITPVAVTTTAMACFSKRNNADDREIAYIENELGKKLVLAKKQPLLKHSMASM